MADITRRIPDCGDCEGGEGGERGERGHRGHRGHDGSDGATGPTGPAGGDLTSPFSIIPFASGSPDSMSHVVGGLADTGAVVGFGDSFEGVAVGGGSVDLTGNVGVPSNMAFSMPRDGTLVQLSVFFSSVVDLALPSGATLIVEIYRSSTPDNIFTPTGVSVALPLPDPVALGTIVSGTAAAAFPVTNQDRLLLVARVTQLGPFDPSAITALIGYISAGLAIA